MKLKEFLLLLYSLTPPFLKAYIGKEKKKIKKRKIKKRMKNVYVSKEELKNIFSEFKWDSDVFLHSSITNIGTIEGGVPYICELILNKVDPEKYTLLVPALPTREKFLDYLRTKPIFDVRTSPVKMGAISEYLSQLDVCKRSIHPTHSVLAIGKKSDYYTGFHHKDRTPFGINSPYYKLLSEKARILYFGVSIYYTTYVHVIEDLFGDAFPVQVYDEEEFDTQAIDWNGNSLTIHTKCHDPKASIHRNVLKLERYFLEEGAILYTHRLGESQITLVNVYKLTVAYLQAMKKGETIYGHFKISDNIVTQIDKLLSRLKQIN
jgi:aminoglycoside 3-N-acetyltransferase